jgi:hypothetical protein
MVRRAFWVLAASGALIAATISSASATLVYDTMTVYDDTDAVIASLVVTQAEQALNPNAINYLACR